LPDSPFSSTSRYSKFSAFAVDARPDLGMVVYNPATPQDAERVRTLLRANAA
jgi:hypothetical protein